MTTRALPHLGVVAGLTGFWVTACVAASRQPGYDPSTDYLSALASTGAVQPAWGAAMFACGSLALGAAAAAVARSGVGRLCLRRTASAALLAGALAVAVAGVARVDCPAGAAGCNAGPRVTEATTSGVVHAGSVGAYQVLLTAAALALAWAVRDDGRRVAAAALAAGAVAATVLAFDPLPLQPGSSQRLWVAAGHALLLTLVATTAGRATVAR